MWRGMDNNNKETNTKTKKLTRSQTAQNDVPQKNKQKS